jgi:hypothetical protein
MQPPRLDPLLYFPAIIIGGMLTLSGLAWLYEKTRKKIVHPRWGTLTYYGDHWVALVPYNNPSGSSVRWEVPGDRKGPDAEALERFEAMWARLPGLLDQIRPHAMVELEDCHDAVAGTRDEPGTRAVIERASSPGGLDKDWVLCGLAIYRGERGQSYWSLEFEVSWDPEHQRMAYLDMDGNFVLYDLSCTVVDL